jgi:hypothetical protein
MKLKSSTSMNTKLECYRLCARSGESVFGTRQKRPMTRRKGLRKQIIVHHGRECAIKPFKASP